MTSNSAVRRSVLLLLGLTSCAVYSPHDRTFVEAELQERTGAALRSEAAPPLPASVDLADGLTVQEADAVALWNNQRFAAVLAELDVSRAEMEAAGLLRNPILSVLFPFGTKQLEMTLSMPLDALWQRPRRVAVAQLDVERVAMELVRSGLDLVRDVELAHADALLAGERAGLCDEQAALMARRAELARLRAAAGEWSEQQAMAAANDAGRSRLAAQRARSDVAAAMGRLGLLLGLPADVELQPIAEPPAAGPPAAFDELAEGAQAARPEVRAAELVLAGAAERAGLSVVEALGISGVFDSNGEGDKGWEAGPGLGVEIPLFDPRRGSADVAAAQARQAGLLLVAVRYEITRELHAAWQQEHAARAELTELRDGLLPGNAEECAAARRQLDAGEDPEDALLAARLRGVALREELAAASRQWRHAHAALQRAAGRRLGS